MATTKINGLAYDEMPDAIIVEGKRYILKDAKRKKRKKKRTGPARLNVNECKGSAINFRIEAIVKSNADGTGLPDLGKTSSVSVKQIKSMDKFPGEVRKLILAEDTGEDVLAEIERQLGKANSTIYHISADGGWDWSDRKGYRGVEEIHKLLQYLKNRKNAIFTYCNNKMNWTGEPGGLV